MKSTLVELAQDLQETNGRITQNQQQIAEVQKTLDSDTAKRADLIAAMQQEFGNVNSNGHVPVASAAKGAKGKKKSKKAAAEVTGGKKKTTNQHILEIVRRHGKPGAPLTPIVTEMTAKQQRGEWETESEDISSVVSQSLNAMKKKKLVIMRRDESINKNVYVEA